MSGPDPRVGDPALVTLEGRVCEVGAVGNTPGIYVSVGGSHYFVPMTELWYHDATWYVEPRRGAIADAVEGARGG